MRKKLKLFYRYIVLKTNVQLFTGFILLFVLITLFLALERKGVLVLKINSDLLVHYLTVIASILGTVGAIIIGLFFFSLQSIETRQQNWYMSIKEETEKLLEILYTLPAELSHISAPLYECIQFLQAKKLRTYPIMGEEWKSIQEPVNIALDKKPVEDFPIVYKMIFSLANIEEYASEIGILKIATICSELVLASLRRLFYLLLISIAAIFYFQLIKEVYIFHPIAIGVIMFCFLYFTCTSILATPVHFQDFYREAIDQGSIGETTEKGDGEQRNGTIQAQ